MSFKKLSTDEISAECDQSDVIVCQLDLSSLRSVRKFCEKVMATEEKVDILIHNAGYCGLFKKAISEDGIEMTMATNHYGPFLMTNLLSPLLKKSAPCRIVVVSALGHVASIFDPTKDVNLNPVNHWFPLQIYADSKFANILFTNELARRLEGSGITVNALHPGVVDTEIWSKTPFPFNLASVFGHFFMLSAWEGIQTTLHVALSPSLAFVSGKYFSNCQIVKPSSKTLNLDWQSDLWEKSKKIVGLKPNDSQF